MRPPCRCEVEPPKADAVAGHSNRALAARAGGIEENEPAYCATRRDREGISI